MRASAGRADDALSSGARWVTCRSCGADQTASVMRSVDRLLGLSGDFQVVRCGRCGFLFTNPQPDEATLERHYPSAYHAAPDPGAANPASRRSWLRARLRAGLLAARGYRVDRAGSLWQAAGSLVGRLMTERFVWIPLFTPGGVLVDVGCGTGAYLAEMRDLGWTAIGIEPASVAAGVARERFGLDVRTGTLEEAALPDACADVVTMRMVLEHARDPAAVLAEVQRILKPGGRLLLSVPNAGSIEAKIFRRHWFAWELPRHLSHFTPVTLAGMLLEGGFGEVRVRHLANANNLAASLRYIQGKDGGVSARQVRPLLPIAALEALCRQSGRIAVEAWKERSPEEVSRHYENEADAAAQMSTALTQRAVSRMLTGVGPVRGIAIDLGCGVGSNLHALKDSARWAVGLDISSSALREAGRRSAGSVPLMAADGTHLPVRSESVHLVVCSEVLEHVADLRAGLSEIGRVLAPGGWLLVTTPSYLNPMGLRKRRMDRWLGGPRWEPWGSHGGGMERFMTPRTLKRALPSTIEIIRRFGIDHYSAWFAPLPLAARVANRPVLRAFLDERIGRMPLLRSLGMHYCVIARKR